MKSIPALIRQRYNRLTSQQRDARYIFIFLIATVIYLITFAQALSNGLFDSFERPLFHAVNQLPSALYPVLYAATQFGSLGSIVLWGAAGWYLVNRRAALTVGYAGVLAWILAKVVKASVRRGRPGSILEHVHFFASEKFTGYGFPSGHAMLSAACATVLFYQVSPRYRKYLVILVGLVGLSRMYLGAHFPLDVFGGWALGAVTGSFVVLVGGVSKPSLSAVKVKRYLRRRGYDITSVRFANVDARGSRPVFITTANGEHYFAKIFGKHEHAADWLFKIYRFFRYKNLQAEEPYLNSRRNIELEAFATLWAKQAGVRAARIIDTVRIGKLWILIQEQVPNSIPFNEAPSYSQAVLDDAWRQIRLLHDSNMAHRDLRAANLLIDNKKQVWLIDFGFAEVSPNKQRLLMDRAELLMSMALLADVKRTVRAARSTFEDDQLKPVLPFLQQAVFSGATTKQLKSQKDCLNDLKAELQKQLGIEDEIVEANILRVNRRTVINLILLAVFFYAIVPQFKSFRDALDTLTDANFLWLPVIVVLTGLTYVATGLIYVILADVPLKLGVTSLVQLAASFVSKVVPAGLGSGSLNSRYFTKAGLSPEDATAVIVSASAIGFIMFSVPLVLLIILTGGSVLSLFHFHVSRLVVEIVLAVLVAVILILAVKAKLRRRVIELLTNFIIGLRDIATSPRQLSLAAANSLLVSLLYIGCLCASLRAFGVHLSIVSVTIAYATATIVRSTIPTPGGLGPFEIALVSSLLGLSVQRPIALAAVILYRLATFWLPIPFSLLAYKRLNNKRLI